MPSQAITSIFQITPRYRRSTNLERDFRDTKSLESYVLTPHGRECLARLAKGLRTNSSQRAWRLTGNYGSGKSSFALFLAHWFSGQAAQLSRTLEVDVRYDVFSLASRPTYLPLLVTGSREPMAHAILRALAQQLSEQYSRGVKSSVQLRIEAALARKGISDSEVVELVREANGKFVKDRKGSGLLILIDELGKFLEYAAYHSGAQDVYLLQRLAEVAATSDQSAPLFVIGMLHQGFDAYAENLDPTAQREWEKVAGRFEEILFNQPLIEISELIASALRVRLAALPKFAQDEARSGFQEAVKCGFFGTYSSKRDLAALGPKIYPLHGTAVAVAVRAFSRFGQNERSLFSFLLSDEPFSLQNFSARRIEPGASYRVADFYDYIRANFGHRLALQSYRSHWTQIESMVESFATADALELAVVKTVGVLNLLDHPDLIATEKTVAACVAGLGGQSERAIASAIDRLHKNRKALFRRGIAGALSLWPHTSVDLEAAYERAAKAVDAVTSVARSLEGFLESRPLVARRHYIETGNLRYFDVHYAPVVEIASLADKPSEADGRIVVALCETAADCDKAAGYAATDALKKRRDLLIAVPVEPLSNQAGLVTELLRWDWVLSNTPELNADRFAREEASRQRQNAHDRLTNRIQDLVGLRTFGGAQALRWFARGSMINISNSRQLLENLSDMCDALYPRAPRVRNELLNRRTLSSQAAAARMRLIEGMLTSAEQPFLGMNPAKKPPEMSMYLSVLKRGRLHVETGGAWCLAIPNPKNDPLLLGPCLMALRSFVEARPDQRIKISELLSLLAQPPFGVREGLSPVFLALFAAMNVQELAFYESGTFLRELGANQFLRLTKAPGDFELQLCRVAGIRQEVFASLLKVLGLPKSRGHEPLVLDVVKPLCQYVATLPDYARNTRRLSDGALRVRAATLDAREPVTLLFKDLPAACGMESFSVDGGTSLKRAQLFASTLKSHLDELRGAFDALLGREQSAVLEEFQVSGVFADVRLVLAQRAASVTLLASEPRLKALCLRLADVQLPDAAWLESLGSLLASQPPVRWSDEEEVTFLRELHSLAQRFRSLESIAFDSPRSGDPGEAFLMSLTKSDGQEAQRVIFVDKDSLSRVGALAAEIEKILVRDRTVGLAALSRVAWSALSKD